MNDKTAITPNVPKSNPWRETGASIANGSTLTGATGATSRAKSASALAYSLVSGAADVTTKEGDIGRSVADENTLVGSGQREVTGDCTVSEEVLFDNFGSTPLGSTDEAGVVGEISARASSAERAGLASLLVATSGATRRAGFDAAVWEEVSPSSRKYQQVRLVPRSKR